MESVWQDVKYGARLLFNNPGFAWSPFSRSLSAWREHGHLQLAEQRSD